MINSSKKHNNLGEIVAKHRSILEELNKISKITKSKDYVVENLLSML